MSDYFFGYRAHRRHPWMAATGTEGLCELCGGPQDDARHDAPYERGTCRAAKTVSGGGYCDSASETWHCELDKGHTGPHQMQGGPSWA